MTKREAIKIFRNDKNSYGGYKAVITKLKLIYKEFEEENEQLKKEIATITKLWQEQKANNEYWNKLKGFN